MDLSSINLDGIYLEALSVSGFLGKRSFRIDFSKQEGKKISIFIGPNAMGKTVLCSFVTTLFTTASKLAREKNDEITVDWGGLWGRPAQTFLEFNQFSLRVSTSEENYGDIGDGTTFSFFYSPKDGPEEKTPCLEFEVVHSQYKLKGKICYVQKAFSSDDSRRLFSSFGSKEFSQWRFVSVERKLKGAAKRSDFLNQKECEQIPPFSIDSTLYTLVATLNMELNKLYNISTVSQKKRNGSGRVSLLLSMKKEAAEALKDLSLCQVKSLSKEIREILEQGDVSLEQQRFIDYFVRVVLFSRCIGSFGDPRFGQRVVIRDNLGNKASPFRITISENGIDQVDSELLGYSSGEKNYFAMFFLLCFRTDRRTHIFVDEPELSLALVEQMKLVERI